MMKSILYVVATPIGNMSDISKRALEVLGEVDFILCEDTRRSGLLLDKFMIKKPLVSYFAHNESVRTEQFIGRLLDGESAAIITDAGTPCISDPGAKIVEACHEAGIAVCPIPGASAVVSTVSVSGFETNTFTFIGFFPRQGLERDALFEAQKTNPHLLVGYESPQRILSLLDNLVAILGEDWEVCLGRELTKRFEQVERTTAGKLREILTNGPCKGEFCLVVNAGEPVTLSDEIPQDAIRLIDIMREREFSDRDIRDVVAAYFNIRPKTVYQFLIK